jgi:putative transposase
MVNYRRNRVPGGTFAFTVALNDRHSDLLTRHVDALRTAFAQVHVTRPFVIHAAVILPEHLHTIWQLPNNDADYSIRWQLIKTSFNRQLKLPRSPWQRRFWEHTIRDDDDFAHHVDYIHYNPVKHGHARHPADWEFSSIHRWIREGRLPSDWGNDPGRMDFGE